jgi:iron(III) transport system permease protein
MSGDSAPALVLWLQGRSLWLMPIGGLGLVALLAGLRGFPQAVQARLLTFVGIAGIGYMLAQGFLFGLRGWNVAWLAQMMGETDQRQFGMGYGAMVAGAGFLFLLTRGLALRGLVAGMPLSPGRWAW